MKIRNLYFYPGRDIEHNYIAYTFHNMLLAGKAGAGKSNFLQSLLVRVIQECHPDDIRVTIHDLKGVEFYHWEANVPIGRFIPQMERVVSYWPEITEVQQDNIVGTVYPYHQFSYEIGKLHAMVEDRIKLLESVGKESWEDAAASGIDIGVRQLILIEEYQAYTNTPESAELFTSFLDYVLPVCERVGVYFILSSQKGLCIDEKYLKHFPIRVVTPCSTKVATSVVGSVEPSNSDLRYGVVWIRYRGVVKMLFVPFYPDTWLRKFEKYYSINTGEK